MPRKSRILFQKQHGFRGSIGAFLLISGGLLVIMMARGFGLLQYWEWFAYDWYVKLRPPSPIEQRIVIVGYSEADIQKLGKPIVSDRTLAELIEKIRAQQPRAIGLDIYRDLPEPPSYKELTESFKSGDSTQEIADEVLSGYKQLERVFQSTPQLVGVWKVGNPEVLPPPTLLKLGRVASVDLIEDGDKVVRRGMLIVTSQSGKNLTSLGLSVALKYLRKSQIKLKFDGDSNVVVGETTFRRFTQNDGGYVGADAGDNQTLLDFRSPNSFPVVSVTDVLQNRIRADLFRDRIVLIGSTAESKKDFFFTPHSRELGGFPRQVPGVEIQANIASQVLASTLDGRPLIQTWSDPFEYLFILSWGAIAAIVTWQCRRSPVNESKRLTFLALALLSCLLLGLLLTGTTYLAFVQQGYWLPVVPAFGTLVWGTTSVILLDYIARERQWRRRLKQKNATLCREKEEKRLALETAEVGIWHWDIATDAVTLSEECLRLFANWNSLLPRTLIEFINLIHAEDRQRFKDGLDSLIETSKKHPGKEKIDLRLCVHQLPNIEPYHIAMFIELGKQHRRAIGTIVNRTRIYQETLAQRQRIEKLDRLLGQSDLAIFTLDPNGDIRYYTPSVSVIFGYGLTELNGVNVIDLVHLDERSNLAQAIIYDRDDLLDGQKIPCRLICVNGSMLAIELQVFNNLADPLLNCLTLYCWRID
jgi:PAS domain S-box-containing protein